MDTKTTRKKVVTKTRASKTTKKTPVTRKGTAKTAVAKSAAKRSKKAPVTRISKETEGEFYKCFTKKDDKTLHSPSITGRLALDYPIGEKTFAVKELVENGYGIMLFRNLEDARDWRSGEIWKVRVGKVFDVPRKRIHRRAGYNLSFEVEKIASNGDFFKLMFSKGVFERYLEVENNWPKGTVMCDWIIPVERVRS